MLEATRYTRIYGQQQLGKCLCVAGNEPTLEKFSLVYMQEQVFENSSLILVSTYCLSGRLALVSESKATATSALTDDK